MSKVQSRTSNWLKISHHRHTGRLRPHEYTSYGPLALLLIVVGVALVFSTVSASPPPGAGSVSLTGTMPGPPPTIGATITSPDNGQHFDATPTPVKGTCPAGTMVEIYKNNIFAGSGPCSTSGTFSIDIDLLFGNNALIAKVYDALNQSGPNSNTVNVSYDVLPLQSSATTPLNFSGAQLILNTDAVYRGTFPGQSLSMPVGIVGGTPPYAVNVKWGDSTNSVVPRSNNTTFTVKHTYKKPGIFQITLQGSDAVGRVAFLTVAAIINGQTSVAKAGGTSTPSSVNKFLVLWPLYAIAASMVVSFWLGERREKHILSGPALRLHPQR